MSRIPGILALGAASFQLACGQWQTIGDIDSVTGSRPGELTVRSGSALVQVRILKQEVVQVRCAPSGSLDPGTSWAVVHPPELAPDAVTRESRDALTLSTRHLSVVVSRRPLRVAVLDSAGEVLVRDDEAKGMAWSGTEVRVWKTMPQGERYYGFGEKAGSLERGCMAMTMWNSDIPAYAADTDPLYQTIPFFYGLRGGRAYGIFFDNTFRSSFDMGKESRSAYSFGAEGGDLNYYVFPGPGTRSILSLFTGLVGRMPLPPLWSLGYQQCRWSYAPEKRVREIASGFRDRRIPCDVIYLDIDYMDGYRIFTWSPKNFPDPKGMIDDLARQGFKVAVIVDPGIKADSAYHAFRSGLAGDCFVRYPGGMLYTGTVWPGVCAFPDFTSERARGWWGDQFGVLVGAGVRGWWNDMNEPSVFNAPTKTIDLGVIHDDSGLRTPHARNHNIYGMQMTRATYDGVRRILPGERPFVLTRASYAGGWRYSASWTGDNVASWEHLAMALSMCLNLSASGQPFVGSDIGGFIGYPSGELFARWLELGVFTPLMRAHSVINEKNKEPWEYGDRYTAINRSTIELRYRMLPYIYTAMQQASETGIAPMRAMMLEYPGIDVYHDRADQFLFGENFLVAPVLQPGIDRREVSLPPGEWYDWWADTVMFRGPSTVSVAAPEERLPLFVRAGAVVPSRQVVQYTAESPIDPLTLSVYPGPIGSDHVSSYYEDDGRSFAYEQAVFLKRTMTQHRGERSTVVRLSACEGKFMPPPRGLLVELKGAAKPPGRVTLDGRVLEQGRETGRWFYDAGRKAVRVMLKDGREEMTLAFVDE